MIGKLKENVMKYGIYHAYRLAIAPNQSTAYYERNTINNAYS